MNWAFTAPGLYRVGFQASGTLTEGDEPVESELTLYTFEVIPVEALLELNRSGLETLTLTLRTQDGIVYQLQSAPAATGPWIDQGQPFIGTGRAKEITVPASGSAGFFRIRQGG